MKDELLASLTPHTSNTCCASGIRLDEAPQAALAGQIGGIDFELIGRLYRGRGDQSDFRELVERAAAAAGVPAGRRRRTASRRSRPGSAAPRR